MTTSTPYPIRRATLDDIDTLLYQRRAMFADIGHADAVQDAIAPDIRQWMCEHITQGDYLAWLVMDGERPAGGAGVWFMQWAPSPNAPSGIRGYIMNVYVEPDYRHQGLARKLMQVILETCREQGVTYVMLHASDKGRPLYETFGFVANNEMRLSL